MRYLISLLLDSVALALNEYILFRFRPFLMVNIMSGKNMLLHVSEWLFWNICDFDAYSGLES